MVKVTPTVWAELSRRSPRVPGREDTAVMAGDCMNDSSPTVIAQPCLGMCSRRVLLQAPQQCSRRLCYRAVCTGVWLQCTLTACTRNIGQSQWSLMYETQLLPQLPGHRAQKKAPVPCFARCLSLLSKGQMSRASPTAATRIRKVFWPWASASTFGHIHSCVGRH